MDIVKLGKKGQLSLPAAVYPIELYSDARVKAFEQANRLTAAESARVAAAIKHPKASKRTKA